MEERKKQEEGKKKKEEGRKREEEGRQTPSISLAFSAHRSFYWASKSRSAALDKEQNEHGLNQKQDKRQEKTTNKAGKDNRQDKRQSKRQDTRQHLILSFR